MSRGVLDRLRAVGLVPVIRADSRETALRIAEVLAEAGLAFIEITMTVPGALDVVAGLGRQFGGAIDLGAGTITSAAMADEAVDAGCGFLVTPCLVPEVITAARARSVPVIAGALTPTEVFQAHHAGADLVKVFPASTAGGPAYIRALRGPFPSIGLVATGGVGLDAIPAYFEAGVAALGVGGEMISRAAVAAGDWSAVRQSARTFLEAVRRARPALPEGVGR